MTNRIVVVSDLHAGCRMGLCPKGGVQLDDGGVYEPSQLQLKVWQMWEHFWDKFVPEHCPKGFTLVVNGDAIEGSHHGATTSVSANPADQVRIAYEILLPMVKRANRLYMVRGTEAHVGQSACNEETLARALGAVPNDQGYHSRWELWKRMGDKTVHFLHHVSSVGVQRGEATAIHAEMVDLFTESGRWGGAPPHVVVRSHRHRHVLTQMEAAHGKCIAFTTAAWQLKTPFCWKVAGARNSTPQVGGHIIKLDDGELSVVSKIWNIERSRCED